MTLPGMRERTILVNSMSKTYSVTGWRVGWVLAPPELTDSIRKVHDFLTVGAAAPLQQAGAVALALPDSYYQTLARRLRRAPRHDPGDAGGRRVSAACGPRGAYYVMTDISGFGFAGRHRLRPPSDRDTSAWPPCRDRASSTTRATELKWCAFVFPRSMRRWKKRRFVCRRSPVRDRTSRWLPERHFTNFLLPETVVREDGAGYAVELATAQGKALEITLGITRILEQESLDVSIWGSVDGSDWGTKPLPRSRRSSTVARTPSAGSDRASRRQIPSRALEDEPLGPRRAEAAVRLLRLRGGDGRRPHRARRLNLGTLRADHTETIA